MKLVWKLLRQHISIPQFVGFFFANLVGVVIILLGVQFYTDIQSVYEGEDSFMKEDYLIINKKVSTINSITGKECANEFTADDIADVEEQKFVEKIGAFTPSDFNVHASFDIDESTHFSTDMFFESVPDEFVDVASDDWKYIAGADEVPIILPKNYLDMYNFGYAQGKNLPKLSAGILGAINLSIKIDNGIDNVGNYNGRIVGFSSRLNTILVPDAFMTWANAEYSTNDNPKSPTRLILQVNDPTDENITTYLQENNYETDEDKLEASKTSFFLRVLVTIVMCVGLVICVLSFYILMLSVFLLVQKNSTKLQNLLLIGYSPSKVSFPYQALTVGLNLFVFILAVVIVMLIRQTYMRLFESFFPDLETPSIAITLYVGIGLLFIVSIFNIIAVRNKVMSIWKRKN